MKLSINGELKLIETKIQDPNLLLVLDELGLNPKLIVIELNGTILNPERWEAQKIKDGDILEIVTIVGGG